MTACNNTTNPAWPFLHPGVTATVITTVTLSPTSSNTVTATTSSSNTITPTYTATNTATATLSSTVTNTATATMTNTPTVLPMVSTLAGQAQVQGSANGAGSLATFTYPYGVAVDSSGNVYVGELGNELIRKITAGGVVSTWAGQTGVAGAANGQGTLATFSHPQGVAVDASGNLYVADTVNNLIRLISPTGLVSTFAGTGASGSANGAVGTATFAYPYAVAVDSSGNVYVSDNTYDLIRKISGGVVSTLAGEAGVSGSANGPGATATFSSPGGVAVDSSGNVYVADSGNHLIRKITSGGTVSTFAGEAGVSGNANGPALSSTFGGADGVAVDQYGNVFVADTIYNQIREISGGMVSTYAGSGANGAANGNPATASFDEPWGIAVDTSENVYVGDVYNDIIRKITP